MFLSLRLCRHSKANKTKIRCVRNIICNARGARSRRVNRTGVSLGAQAQAQDDPIKLRRVRVGGDDPLIGDIHVSSAESTARRLTKRHKSIYVGDTKVERRRAPARKMTLMRSARNYPAINERAYWRDNYQRGFTPVITLATSTV